MRLFLFTLIFLASLHQSFAQLSAKRYVFVEHFTNSRCPICASSSKNPAFFTLMQKYASDVHHIAVHPSFPYVNCIFYQAAKEDNTARVSLYPQVVGTPTWVFGGNLVTQNFTEAMFTERLTGRSPVSLEVRDTPGSGTFSTSIRITNHSALPAGKYKLYAVLVEKRIDYNAPNGEKVHYNVLRRLLNGKDGTDIANLGASAVASFSFSGATLSDWKSDQLATVAFIQNVDTKEVLNSGTRFDSPVVTSSVANLPEKSVSVYPNPVLEQAHLRLPHEAIQSLILFNSNGQRVQPTYEQTPDGLRLDMHALPKGLYILKITTQQAIYAGKFVKS